jgi:hypothetical protein
VSQHTPGGRLIADYLSACFRAQIRCETSKARDIVISYCSAPPRIILIYRCNQGSTAAGTTRHTPRRKKRGTAKTGTGALNRYIGK